MPSKRGGPRFAALGTSRKLSSQSHHPVLGYIISQCNASESLICLTSGLVPEKPMKAMLSSDQTRGHCGYIYVFFRGSLTCNHKSAFIWLEHDPELPQRSTVHVLRISENY